MQVMYEAGGQFHLIRFWVDHEPVVLQELESGDGYRSGNNCGNETHALYRFPCGVGVRGDRAVGSAEGDSPVLQTAQSKSCYLVSRQAQVGMLGAGKEMKFLRMLKTVNCSQCVCFVCGHQSRLPPHLVYEGAVARLRDRLCICLGSFEPGFLGYQDFG